MKIVETAKKPSPLHQKENSCLDGDLPRISCGSFTQWKVWSIQANPPLPGCFSRIFCSILNNLQARFSAASRKGSRYLRRFETSFASNISRALLVFWYCETTTPPSAPLMAVRVGITNCTQIGVCSPGIVSTSSPPRLNRWALDSAPAIDSKHAGRSSTASCPARTKPLPQSRKDRQGFSQGAVPSGPWMPAGRLRA